MWQHETRDINRHSIMYTAAATTKDCPVQHAAALVQATRISQKDFSKQLPNWFPRFPLLIALSSSNN